MRKQTASSRLVGQTRDYGDPPQLPGDNAVLRGVDAAEFNRRMVDWWVKVKAHLREVDEELEELRTNQAAGGE
jgi:hypothetical protein